MDQMDQMFHGVVVDGSTSFVAGTMDEEEEDATDDPEQVHTPVNISSHKRASSTSTTGSSSHKKSPTLRAMNKYMSDNAKIQAERNDMFKQHLSVKQQRENANSEKIRLVQQLARECGVSETIPEWFAVHRICNEENSMEFFIGMSTVEGRLAFLKHYAKVNNLM